MESTSSLRNITNLSPGDHLCCFYEREAEHRAVLTPFLRQGLERGEKVLYIADSHTAEAVLAYLREDGVEVEPYLARGQLRIQAADDTYMRDGCFDPDGMIALLRSETDRALTEGYAVLRITAEMTWVLRGLPGSERLVEYEAKLNEFYLSSKCLGICQYDRRRFDPAVQLDVLHTHPIVVIGTEVYENFYYMPPAAFLSNLPAARLQQWIHSLAQRRRAEEALIRERDYSQMLVEGANAIVVGLDPEGRITLVNRAAEEITGYRRVDLLGKNWFDVLVPRARYPQVWEEFERLTAGGLPGEFENPILTAAGEERIIAWRNSVLQAGGSILGTISFGIDTTERKQAEEALRESERKLRLITENTTDVIFAYDMERRLIYVNPAVEELTGYTVAELREKNFINWLHPEDEARMMRWWEELFAGKSFRGEFRIITKDGQVKWVLSSWGPLYDESGREIGIQGLERDITERKRAEAALLDRTQQLEAIRAVTTEITRELNLTTLLELINRRAAELVGGVSGTVYLWDETAQALVPAAWHGFTGWAGGPPRRLGEGVVGTVAQRRRGMIVNDYRTSPYAYPLSLESTPITAVLAEPLLYGDRLLGVITIDIHGGEGTFTERDRETLALFATQAAIAIENARLYETAQRELADRRAVEAALRQSEARFRAIFDRVGIGMAVMDLSGRFVECNAAFERMFGYTGAELRDMTFSEITHPGDVNKQLAAFREGLVSANMDHGSQFETRYVTKNGSVVWGRLTNTFIPDAEGKPQFSIGMFEDVTARKLAAQARIRLRRRIISAQEDERRRVARELHDETGQALTSMALTLRALETAPNLEEVRVRSAELRGLAARTLEDIHRLVTDLRPSLLDDLGLIAALEQHVQGIETTSGLQIDLCAEGIDAMRLSPELTTAIYRIVQETLTNVVRHASARRASVLLQRRGKAMVVVVEDDGRGFDPAEYFRAGRQGLGLMGIEERAFLFGGAMTVDSSPGKGTTIAVEIPMEAP